MAPTWIDSKNTRKEWRSETSAITNKTNIITDNNNTGTTMVREEGEGTTGEEVDTTVAAEGVEEAAGEGDLLWREVGVGHTGVICRVVEEGGVGAVEVA